MGRGRHLRLRDSSELDLYHFTAGEQRDCGPATVSKFASTSLEALETLRGPSPRASPTPGSPPGRTTSPPTSEEPDRRERAFREFQGAAPRLDHEKESKGRRCLLSSFRGRVRTLARDARVEEPPRPPPAVYGEVGKGGVVLGPGIGHLSPCFGCPLMGLMVWAGWCCAPVSPLFVLLTSPGLPGRGQLRADSSLVHVCTLIWG